MLKLISGVEWDFQLSLKLIVNLTVSKELGVVHIPNLGPLSQLRGRGPWRISAIGDYWLGQL